MKSVKPGRGPSAMGAAGSIFAIIFGIFWTMMAYSMTRDAPFPLIGFVFPAFGIVFIGFGIVQAIFHYKNATSQNRMSLFDITDSQEESDPLNTRYGKQFSESGEAYSSSGEKAFCPYCGDRLKDGYQYCPKCGKKI